MFAPKKGKEPTKGQKRITEDNKSTLNYYGIMAAASIIPKWLLSGSLLNLAPGLIFAILIQGIGVGGLFYLSDYVDLQAGLGDYLKDLIITTTVCTLLSLMSSLFWILWLWLPGFWIYKIWMNVVAPWIFAPPPEDKNPEATEKKRRKMERKMARAGYR